MRNIINKTMDRDDLDNVSASKLIDELNQLIITIKAKNLKISSWYGCFDLPAIRNSAEWINRGIGYTPLQSAADDCNFPWFLYWEIVWLLLNNDFQPGQSVLDLGGSSSLFSYFLAHKGLNVTTVDLQSNLVENANIVADKMSWSLKNIVMDMRELSLTGQFNHVTSVCVFEHIPMYARVEINKKIKKIIKPEGYFSITFDYRNPSNAAKIDSPEEVDRQFIIPSGLSPRGNMPFYDNGKNYLLHPFYSNSDKVSDYKEWAIKEGHFNASELGIVKNENDYTFGALFLQNAVRPPATGSANDMEAERKVIL